MAILSPSRRRMITRFASQESSRNDAMHRMPHLRQTARMATRLARAECADAEACWAAGMLHDIKKESPGDHGAFGARAAAAFLKKLGLPPAFVESVRDAIHFHNKGFRSGPLQRQILWDADKLSVITPAGFKSRMLPFWIERLGKKKGVEMSIYEYRLFKRGLHTETAKSIMRRHSKRMARIILCLEREAESGQPLRRCLHL